MIAAFGWLILSGAIPSPSASAQAERVRTESDMVAQLKRIAAAVEKTPSAPSPDAGCQAGQDKRQSDLCAQWKAADAAEAGARWGWWQLIIGAVGLILGGITMGAAIAAAVFAKRAAVATEETVSIAKDAAYDATEALAIAERNATAAAAQVALSEVTAKRQLRAYIEIFEVSIVPCEDASDIPASIRIVTKNGGVTPGYNCKSFFELVTAYGGNRHSELEPAVAGPGLGCKSILGGSGQTSGIALPEWQTQIVDIMSGRLVLFVHGWVEYTDIFGDDHRTTMRYFIDAGSAQGAFGIVVASNGNQST